MISIEELGVPAMEMIITPIRERMDPKAILMVIFSLRNSVAKMTMNMGMVAIMRLAALAEIYCSP